MNRARSAASDSAERRIAGVLVRHANRHGVLAVNAVRRGGYWRMDTVFGWLTLAELSERIGEHDEHHRYREAA